MPVPGKLVPCCPQRPVQSQPWSKHVCSLLNKWLYALLCVCLFLCYIFGKLISWTASGTLEQLFHLCSSFCIVLQVAILHGNQLSITSNGTQRGFELTWSDPFDLPKFCFKSFANTSWDKFCFVKNENFSISNHYEAHILASSLYWIAVPVNVKFKRSVDLRLGENNIDLLRVLWKKMFIISFTGMFCLFSHKWAIFGCYNMCWISQSHASYFISNFSPIIANIHSRNRSSGSPDSAILLGFSAKF